MREKNRRKSSALFLTAAVLILAAVTVAGILLEGEAVETDFTRKNLPPSASWLFRHGLDGAGLRWPEPLRACR